MRVGFYCFCAKVPKLSVGGEESTSHCALRRQLSSRISCVCFVGVEMKVLKSSIAGTAEQWMQWAVLYTYMNFLLSGAVAGWLVWVILVVFVPVLRYPLLLYIAWIYYDRKSGELGKRRSSWVRSLRYWKLHNDFFPAKLHKTVDLSPDRNYLICVFPHGVLSTGCFCAFGNDHGNFSNIFPGLRSYMVTLAQHFITPFIREFSLTIGGLPASASCLNYFLGTKKGVALALVVGGAHEAFYTKPGVYRVYLSKRKGFVKIAYKNGVPLVPAISFGEPDIYDQVLFPENSIARKVQVFIKKVTGIAPILFYGQFSVVPYRKPLNVVVGAPLEVEKIEEPSQEEVDNLHGRFIDALIKLFETEKHKYIENAESTHLEIL